MNLLTAAWARFEAWYDSAYDSTAETRADLTRRKIHSAAQDVPPDGLSEKQSLTTVLNFLFAARRVLVVQSFQRGLSPVEERTQKQIERSIDYLTCVQAFGPEHAERVFERLFGYAP